MSRGPGKWMRAVLETIANADNDGLLPAWVSVDDVAHWVSSQSGVNNCRQGQHLSNSDREAIRRAMRTLAEKGMVEKGMVYRQRPTNDGDDWYYYGSTVQRQVLAVRRLLDEVEKAIEVEDRAQRLHELEAIISRIRNPLIR